MMVNRLLVVVALAAGWVVLADPRPCPPGCTCTTGNLVTIACPSLTPSDADALLDDVNQVLASLTDAPTSLSITDSPLKQLPLNVCRLTSLTALKLDNNKLTSLPDRCINKLKSLTTLSVTNNELTYLQDGLFDGLSRLNSLNINYNRISKIGLRVFSNASDLPALRHIGLGRNQLTTVEPWPLIRGLVADINNRVEVNLEGNLISNFTNEVGFQYDCSQNVYTNLNMEDNKIRHLADILSGWGIDSTQQILCLFKYVNRHGNFALSLASFDNTFVCDCQDYPFMVALYYAQHQRLLSGAYCMWPAHLAYVEVMRVPLDQFVCDVTDRCPSNCSCIYQPSNRTMHVDCSRAGLTSLPDELPPLPKSYVRYKLVFTGNNLERLEHRNYFFNTIILDLRDGRIREIDGGAWRSLTNIDAVILDGNMLTSLPVSLVVQTNVSSKVLSLGRNPWRCSCDERWMTTWLNGIRNKLANPDDIICQSPQRLRGTSILQIPNDGAALCTDPVTEAIVISVSSLISFVVLIVCLSVAAYRLRVQMHSRWKFHPFDRDECHGEDMLYDVFLCCSYNDHEQYGLVILEVLESNNYRVCYHLRDFVCGELVDNNIVQAVEKSKRTLCLLSDDFIRSVYCMREFNVALHHNVTTKRSKRLIVLMMLDNPSVLYQGEENEDMVALRQYLRQYTYIDYRTNDWRQKLLYALPMRGMNSVDTDEQMLAGVGIDDDEALLQSRFENG